MSSIGLSGEASIGPEVLAQVKEELDESEKLLWVGQPKTIGVDLPSCLNLIFMVPFGIVFAFFGLIFIVASLFADEAPFFVPLVGMLVVLIGLRMVVIPIRRSRKIRRANKRACYAVTNQRAIVWEPGSDGNMTVRVRSIKSNLVVHNPSNDGSGDLIFEEHSLVQSHSNQIGFSNIANVREVKHLIEEKLRSELAKEGTP